MEKNSTNIALIAKIKELNEIEMNKAKLLTAIFVKTTEDIKAKKIQDIKNSFQQQIDYYDQSMEDYEKEYEEILGKSKNQLAKIVDKYTELFINMELELQEAQCNQIVAITNIMKRQDVKNQMLGKTELRTIEEYTKKIEACVQKKVNYEIVIAECEKELDDCIGNLEEKISSLFGSNVGKQMLVKEDGFFTKLINKLKNFFTGEAKFRKYYLEPVNVELEMLEEKLPNLTGEVEDETIQFVAKIKQAKAQTNDIYNRMLLDK